MGRISNLPDDLICHIISFLSATEAVRFKYASKKWLNLDIFIPDPVFDSSSEISATFKDFTDQLVARDTSYRIRRCSLKLRSMGFAPYDLVNACLHNVLKRGVFDLELDINANSLPSEVFTCKKVVKLKLGSGFVIDMIPEDALFPALKTLTLDSLGFDDKYGCAFQRLLSACPVLEELVIDDLNWEQWKWSGVVSSPTLKRFTTLREWEAEDDEIHFQSISFDTPSLVYLEYCDIPQNEYEVVNLNSLVEAKLSLPMYYSDYYNFDLTNMIKGLKNVQILSIGFEDTIGLFNDFSESVPVFDNLFHLSVRIDICWIGLLVLLKNSPNLKNLTIEGSLHYHPLKPECVCKCLLGYSFLVSCPIEVLKITHFIGEDAGEMLHMKHVLENSPCLVLLELHVQETTDDKKLKIMKDLLMLPRASFKCKVQLMFYPRSSDWDW